MYLKHAARYFALAFCLFACCRLAPFCHGIGGNLEKMEKQKQVIDPMRIALPEKGKLYHGVFPGSPYVSQIGPEDTFKLDDIKSYEQAVGKKAAWVYFSDNWFRTRAFPMAMSKTIRDQQKAIPFIRLMLRSDEELGHSDVKYSLKNIIEGKFDPNLQMWGLKAAEFGTPLIVEWGTECNDYMRSWSGHYNGVDRKGKQMTTSYGDLFLPDGPEEFVAAYRHIVHVIRDEAKAKNITWVFHINALDNPSTPENAFENFYPGDDVVDWIGISAYGSKDPHATEPTPLIDLMDECYPRVRKLAPTKPIVIAELGCTVGKYMTNDKWAEAAFKDLFSNRWPEVVGFTWWNLRWKIITQSKLDEWEEEEEQQQQQQDESGGGGAGGSSDSGDSSDEGTDTGGGGGADTGGGGGGGSDMEDDNEEDYTNMRVQHKNNIPLVTVMQKIFKEASNKLQESVILEKK